MRTLVSICLMLGSFVSARAVAAPVFDDKPVAEPAAEAAKPAGRGAEISIASFLDASKVGLAPVRWGGSITDTFRWSKPDVGDASTTHFQSVVLRAASYLWQPWLAQISGDINLSRGVADSSGGDSETESQSVSGSAALNVFPDSRFPFVLTYSLSDNRTQAKITQETTNERISLSQQYRPVIGRSNYLFKYDRSSMTSNSEHGKDTVDSWQGTYTNSIGDHRFALDGQYTVSDQGGDGEKLALENFKAEHGWNASEKLSVDNEATMTRSKFENADSPTNRTQYLQANSNASWSPNDKTSVNGSLRYFDLSSKSGGSSAEAKSLSGNASINYRYTKNLSFNGGITIATTHTDEDTTTISTQNAHVSYNNDPQVFGNFSYNWNATGGISSQWSTEESSDPSYNAGATHTLNHNHQINQYASITSYASQSLAWRHDDTSGNSETLSHNAGISMGINPSEAMGSSLSLSASDTRTFGQERSDNQSVSLQANANLLIDVYSSLSANFNVQWNRSGTEEPESDGLATWSATGGVSYRHGRAFGIPRLQYSLMANVNYAHSNARTLGDADAERVRNGYSVDQHLDYRIGRMDARLTATQAVQDGEDNAMIYLQIGRAFGNY